MSVKTVFMINFKPGSWINLCAWSWDNWMVGVEFLERRRGEMWFRVRCLFFSVGFHFSNTHSVKGCEWASAKKYEAYGKDLIDWRKEWNKAYVARAEA